MASLICGIILDIYGSYQNTNAVIFMMNNSFTKSNTSKFVILCCISNTFGYLVKFITKTWFLIDGVETCYYFTLGLLCTEFLGKLPLFGISCLRFISVVKKKKIIKMDQFEDVLWKFMFPIFLAVSFALTHKLLKSAASEIQQVRK